MRTTNYYSTKVAPEGCVLQMDHAGFKAGLMRAARLQDNGMVHGLPQGSPVPVYPIASLPGCPSDWVREAGTYVCPIEVGWGLWFDWTKNDALNTAVIPSVKGMNPITGRKLEGFGMEAYVDKCPIHDEPFAHGRKCEKCGYEWPSQNYVCAPDTLWWDGFRQPDGCVRQFFFTDEDKRDIASAVIGKANTVPAFGFVFYKPKNPRTPPKVEWRDSFGTGYGGIPFGGGNIFIGHKLGEYDQIKTKGPIYYSSDHISYDSNVSTTSVSFSSNTKSLSGEVKAQGLMMNAEGEKEQLTSGNMSVLRSARCCVKKDVAVGAGAKIRQELSTDSLGMDGWQDKHSATIRLYFCFEEQFKQIVKNGGVKIITSNANGFLDGLPVG
jgi:hypothetical protein